MKRPLLPLLTLSYLLQSLGLQPEVAIVTVSCFSATYSTVSATEPPLTGAAEIVGGDVAILLELQTRNLHHVHTNLSGKLSPLDSVSCQAVQNEVPGRAITSQCHAAYFKRDRVLVDSSFHHILYGQGH